MEKQHEISIHVGGSATKERPVSARIRWATESSPRTGSAVPNMGGCWCLCRPCLRRVFAGRDCFLFVSTVGEGCGRCRRRRKRRGLAWSTQLHSHSHSAGCHGARGRWTRLVDKEGQRTAAIRRGRCSGPDAGKVRWPRRSRWLPTALTRADD